LQTRTEYSLEGGENISLTLNAGVDELRSNQIGTRGDSLVSRVKLSAILASALPLTDGFRLTAGLAARTVDNASSILPQVALECQFSKTFSISATAGLAEHPPTFNQLFWKDGGVRSLEPERGKAAEITAAYRTLESNYTLTAKLTGFYYDITDQVVWSPGQDGRYRPGNIQHAVVAGGEASFDFRHRLGGTVWVSARGSYCYLAARNRSQGVGEDIEVPYSSPTQSLLVLGVSDTAGSALTVIARYRGHRYTDFSNSPSTWLPPYTVMDLTASSPRIRPFERFECQFFASLRNMWNEHYNEVPNFPMPGRSIHFFTEFSIH
jgi:outer membrane cobalamin receptor